MFGHIFMPFLKIIETRNDVELGVFGYLFLIFFKSFLRYKYDLFAYSSIRKLKGTGEVLSALVFLFLRF